MTSPMNWKEYFTHLGEKSIISNEIATLFMSISVPVGGGLTEATNRLSCDKGDSVLLFYSKKGNAMTLSHSICDLGNSNISPEANLVTLNGLASKDAISMSFDIDSLFKDFEIQIPKIEDIKAADSKESFEVIKAPIKNAASFKSYPFILIPPFLWKPVIETKDMSLEGLLILISKILEDFKEANKDDEEKNNVEKI